jgi:hypothetical protein
MWFDSYVGSQPHLVPEAGIRMKTFLALPWLTCGCCDFPQGTVATFTFPSDSSGVKNLDPVGTDSDVALVLFSS